MGERRFRESDVSEDWCFRETYISATLGNISIAETSLSRKHQSLKISHVISQKNKSEDRFSWKKMVKGRRTKIFKTFVKIDFNPTPPNAPHVKKSVFFEKKHWQILNIAMSNDKWAIWYWNQTFDIWHLILPISDVIGPRQMRLT